MKQHFPASVKAYEDQLQREIKEDGEGHGKKPFDDDDDNEGSPKPETRLASVSTTDTESGLFHKGEHEKCFAYRAYTDVTPIISSLT